MLAQTPSNLMFTIACFRNGIDFKVSLNNHLININYHQKIVFN